MYKTILIAVTLLFSLNTYSYSQKARGGAAEEKKVRTQTNRELTDEQIEANEKFRRSLRDMDPEQRREAILIHRAETLGEKSEFAEQRRQQNYEHLKQRLDNNPYLSEEEKDELIKHFQNKLDEGMPFRQIQIAENADFLENIANNPDLTYEERLKAIDAHFSGQRIENRDFLQQRREENIEQVDEMTDEKKEKRKESAVEKKQTRQERRKKR